MYLRHTSSVLYLFLAWVAKSMRILAVTLGLVMLASPVVGHELLIYTVIVNSEGGQPADIPNGTLKEGDSAWFWMKDTTENATLIVEVEKDGAKMRSPVLQFECELDDNGTRVNEECTNRFDFVFNQHNSAGLWNFTFLTYVNDTLSKTSYGSVYIQEDLHEKEVIDDASKDELEISKQTIAAIVAVISLFAIAILLSQNGPQMPFEEE
tara:strand:- start:805 stop:1431 length:627 start_codon:yes stop_codon:yes gene_type:complete